MSNGIAYSSHDIKTETKEVSVVLNAPFLVCQHSSDNRTSSPAKIKKKLDERHTEQVGLGTGKHEN